MQVTAMLGAPGWIDITKLNKRYGWSFTKSTPANPAYLTKMQLKRHCVLDGSIASFEGLMMKDMLKNSVPVRPTANGPNLISGEYEK